MEDKQIARVERNLGIEGLRDRAISHPEAIILHPNNGRLVKSDPVGFRQFFAAGVAGEMIESGFERPVADESIPLSPCVSDDQIAGA